MTFARALVFGQTGSIVLALGALAFQPPAHGRMMLMPLNTQAAARLAPLAIDNGAALVGRGPAGSLVVTGDRARLAALYSAGILVLAAPPAGCNA